MHILHSTTGVTAITKNLLSIPNTDNWPRKRIHEMNKSFYTGVCTFSMQKVFVITIIIYFLLAP